MLWEDFIFYDFNDIKCEVTKCYFYLLDTFWNYVFLSIPISSLISGLSIVPLDFWSSYLTGLSC
jgi:hypothetical protein